MLGMNQLHNERLAILLMFAKLTSYLVTARIVLYLNSCVDKLLYWGNYRKLELKLKLVMVLYDRVSDQVSVSVYMTCEATIYPSLIIKV